MDDPGAVSGECAIKAATQVEPLDEYLRKLRDDAKVPPATLLRVRSAHLYRFSRKRATGRVALEIETYSALCASNAVQPSLQEPPITLQDSIFVETLAQEKYRRLNTWLPRHSQLKSSALSLKNPQAHLTDSGRLRKEQAHAGGIRIPSDLGG